MKAFLNDESVKAKYLARVRAHGLADEIVKGKYWRDGKGCAVGCTIHSGNHKAYETELGIPEWLARVEDVIFEGLPFEGLPNEKAKSWPELFLKSIKTGVDLEQIKTPFLIFILRCSLESLSKVKYDEDKFPDVKVCVNRSRVAIEEVIRCHENGSDLSAAARSAEGAAAAAAAAAAWAAWAAARSAEAAAYEKFACKLIELIEAVG